LNSVQSIALYCQFAVGILRHAGIGNRQAQKLRLRHRGVDEFLAQLVVGKTLDLPLGRSVAVLARLVGRNRTSSSTGHHQRSSAFCAIAFWSSVPRAKVTMISKPWRW